MSVYFDASLIVSLFVQDAQTDRAEAYLDRHRPTVTLSDFAALEVASAINLRVRTKQLTRSKARSVLGDFDVWRARGEPMVSMTSGDIASADALMRRLDLSLRAPDALNIVIAQRCRLPLATFDAQMAASAKSLGVALAPT